MAQYNLNRIFNPRQVAVVGASEKGGHHRQRVDQKSG
jgi:acyl-CoA synthetase (NDP forming)